MKDTVNSFLAASFIIKMLIMTLGSLLTGLIFLITGSILYYFLIPKTEESVSKQRINIRFLLHSTISLFRPVTGSIFILLGLLHILMFCLGIDGGNCTPEKEDNMSILHGIILLICALSLEYHVQFFIRKVKPRFRLCSKIKNNNRTKPKILY